jgi:hypothetical protein
MVEQSSDSLVVRACASLVVSMDSNLARSGIPGPGLTRTTDLTLISSPMMIGAMRRSEHNLHRRNGLGDLFAESCRKRLQLICAT